MMGAMTTPTQQCASAAARRRCGGATRAAPGRSREVAEEFGVTHRTVRHYEDLGLISPERRGTTRVYHRRDRTRLNLILRGKRLGFPLEEIRTIIDLYDAPRGRGAASSSTCSARSTTRRADLEQRRRDIEDALAELGEFERRCREDLDRQS